MEITHRIVAAWENIVFVEEEVGESGEIVYYRAVNGGEAGWKLAKITPTGEPPEKLLRAKYEELLSMDVDAVEFLDPQTTREALEELEYLVMLYEEASIPRETIGIGEIDRILGMHYEALEAKRGALSSWYKHAKEALKHKSELLKDIELEDPSEMGTGAKSTLGAFTFIDELVNKIAKGAMDFVMWVKQRLDEFFWWVPWPFHDPLVNAILAVVATPIAQFVFIIFVFIIKSDVGKMVLSGVYMLIQMGADIIQIVAAGLAWLIMKAIEFLAWLLGNIISVVVDFLGVPDPAKSIIRDVLCGTLNNIADWAGQQALYMEHIVAERLEHLAEVALSFLGPIVGPVAMIVDAVRELFGSFLMD